MNVGEHTVGEREKKELVLKNNKKIERRMHMGV